MTMKLCTQTLKDMFKYVHDKDLHIYPTTITGVKTAYDYGVISAPVAFVRWNGKSVEGLIFTPHPKSLFTVIKQIANENVFKEEYYAFTGAQATFEDMFSQHTNWEINRTNRTRNTPLENAKFGMIVKVKGKYRVIVNQRHLCNVPIQTVLTLFEFYA